MNQNKDTGPDRENELNEKLKEAGLYEEGLTINEKQQLLNCIVASECSAKFEEEQRKELLASSKKSKEHQGEHSAIATSATSNLQSLLPSEQIRQNNSSIFSPKQPNNDTACGSYNSSPIISKTEANSPIIGKRKLESHHNSEEDCLNTSTDTVIYPSDCSDNDSDINIVSSSEEFNNNHSKILNTKILVEEASPDIICDSPNKNTSNSCDNQQSVKQQLPDKNDQSSNLLSCVSKSVDSLHLCSPLTKPHTSSKLVHNQEIAPISSSTNDDQNHNKSNDERFSPTITLPHRNMKTENINKCLFRHSFETRSQCVQRIYSLLTETHENLKAYQSTLKNHVKWGKPICVGRNILTRNCNKPKLSNITKETNMLSDSENHISDLSDDDFEIFPTRFKSNSSSKRVSTNNSINRERKKKLKFDDTFDSPENKVSNADKLKGSLNLKDQAVPEIDENEEIDDMLPDVCIKTNDFYSTSQKDNKKTAKSVDLTSMDLNPQNIEKAIASSSGNINKKFFSNNNEEIDKCKDDSSPLKTKISPESKNPLVEMSSDAARPSETTPQQSSRAEDQVFTDKVGYDYDSGVLSSRKLKRGRGRKKLNKYPTIDNWSANTVTTISENFEIRPSPLKYRGSSKKRVKESVDDDISIVSVKSQKNGNKEEVANSRESATDVATTSASAGRSGPRIETSAGEIGPGSEVLPDGSHGSSPPHAKSAKIQCPMCQLMFPPYTIEAHASFCDGPPDLPDLRDSTRNRSALSSGADVVIIDQQKKKR